jgi:hypothetical protein
MKTIETHGYRLALYSQKNLKWSNQTLGTCNGWTIGKGGCKITCYGMLLGDHKIRDPKGVKREANPSIVDWIATVKKWYFRGCLSVDSIFCKGLALVYNRSRVTSPDYPCIAETNYYVKNGYKQHFFIHLPDGNIIDPLDWIPRVKKNKYAGHIVSYRWIKPYRKVEVKCTHCCPKHCK